MRAIDRIQRRYGYTDDYLLSIPYARLDELMRLTAKWEHEETKQRYRESAVVSWRIESRLTAMFADAKKELKLPSLMEYWDDIGIGDGSTIKKREGEMAETAEEAINNAYKLFGVLPKAEPAE